MFELAVSLQPRAILLQRLASPGLETLCTLAEALHTDLHPARGSAKLHFPNREKIIADTTINHSRRDTTWLRDGGLDHAHAVWVQGSLRTAGGSGRETFLITAWVSWTF